MTWTPAVVKIEGGGLTLRLWRDLDGDPIHVFADLARCMKFTLDMSAPFLTERRTMEFARRLAGTLYDGAPIYREVAGATDGPKKVYNVFVLKNDPILVRQFCCDEPHVAQLHRYSDVAAVETWLAEHAGATDDPTT